MLKFLPQDKSKLNIIPVTNHHFSLPLIKNKASIAKKIIIAPIYAGAATMG